MHDPDLLFITETWLSAKILSSEITGNLPYRIYRSDRKGRRGGGVCCLVKDVINVFPVPLDSCLRSDLLCLEGSNEDGIILFKIVLIYRPPNSSCSDDNCLLDSLTELCLSSKHLIVLGDLNIDFNYTENGYRTSNIKKFEEFFSLFGLSQQVAAATRGKSVLDVILISAPILRNISILPPLASSDHNIVSFEIMCSYAKPHRMPSPDFNRANYVGLSEFFCSVNWWRVFHNYTCLEDMYKRFCHIVYVGMSKYVPFHTVETQRHGFAKHITNLISQKARLFNTLPNPMSHPEYKKVNLALDFHLKKFLANRERRVLSSRNRNAIFSLVRKKIKGVGKLPVLLDDSGNRFLSDNQKAEALAGYFASVFAFDYSIGVFPPENQCSANSLSKMCVEPSAVLRAMKTLSTSNAFSCDGIPQIVYKKCVLALYRPLSMILNSSLLFCEVPITWKRSIVTAIPKSPNASLLSLYRPVSIIPTPVKILEKLVRDKIADCLDKKNLIPLEQHGFMSGASTITQLADCMFD